MFARNQASLFLILAAIFGAFACSWTSEDEQAFYSMLIVGTVIGTLFAIICIVFGALPLCCGVMKPTAKIVATIIIFVGSFVVFIPAITGKAQADAAVEKMCERCEASSGHTGCSPDDKTKAKEIIGALGMIVAYIHGMGFLCIILGITAAVLGCCICCKCCKMKDEVVFAGGGAPQAQVMGQVVGAPVSEENKA